MTVAVPARLRSVAALVPPTCTRVADVGAGHGALAAHLAQDGVASVIAIERWPGPLAELRANLARWGVDALVEVRHGAGLAPLLPAEVELAVIAGMGATTSLLIAADAPGRAVRWLILQCMQRDHLVEPWLAARGWPVRASHECVQRGRRYTARLVEVQA
jgi:tRNA (adenine22-N1)-methyltransferase